MTGMRNRRWAVSLRELAVVAGIVALGVLVLAPTLSQAREESRAAQCGANLAKIGEAYGLWAADNGGFMPPRCRAAGATCQLQEVPVRWLSKGTLKKEWIAYAGSYDHGLRIVGNSPIRSDAPDPPTPGNPDHYIDANDRPLNRYIVPNWECGRRLDATRCPADIYTLKAPSQNPYPRGFPADTVGSSFDIHGTSYGTNVVTMLPWRGHGPWALPVEVANNQQAGPNFNPQRIFSPGRYVMTLDMASFHYNWEMWLYQFHVGQKSGVGAWHEMSPTDSWQHGNALFGDNHVAYGAYYVPIAPATLAAINDYVRSEWSLYPLKLMSQVGS